MIKKFNMNKQKQAMDVISVGVRYNEAKLEQLLFELLHVLVDECPDNAKKTNI